MWWSLILVYVREKAIAEANNKDVAQCFRQTEMETSRRPVFSTPEEGWHQFEQRPPRHYGIVVPQRNGSNFKEDLSDLEDPESDQEQGISTSSATKCWGGRGRYTKCLFEQSTALSINSSQ